MFADSRQQAEAFKTTLEGKIHQLVSEFADGRISREQFNVLYERYNGRLSITNHALLSGTPEAFTIAQGGPSTIAIRDATMGKALGLMIYHNRSGTIVETLGDFNAPLDRVGRVLNDYSQMMVDGQFIDRHIENLDSRQWLLFVPGRFTTTVTLFHNEPSPLQIRELERMQHHFEEANRVALVRERIESNRLAYPFIGFVQKQYGKK
jgi:hypothetical protein